VREGSEGLVVDVGNLLPELVRSQGAQFLRLAGHQRIAHYRVLGGGPASENERGRQSAPERDIPAVETGKRMQIGDPAARQRQGARAAAIEAEDGQADQYGSEEIERHVRSGWIAPKKSGGRMAGRRNSLHGQIGQ